VRVDSAHHGVCPPVSNHIYRERAAQMFSAPRDYRRFRCTSFTQHQLLHDSACGMVGPGNNTVFITFDLVQTVRLGSTTIHVRTFGGTWRAVDNLSIVFFSGTSFPSGYYARTYHGPELYALFEVKGDPLSLASGECPTQYTRWPHGSSFILFGSSTARALSVARQGYTVSFARSVVLANAFHRQNQPRSARQ